jgi:hypothetical protein
MDADNNAEREYLKALEHYDRMKAYLIEAQAQRAKLLDSMKSAEAYGPMPSSADIQQVSQDISNLQIWLQAATERVEKAKSELDRFEDNNRKS